VALVSARWAEAGRGRGPGWARAGLGSVLGWAWAGLGSVLGWARARLGVGRARQRAGLGAGQAGRGPGCAQGGRQVEAAAITSALKPAAVMRDMVGEAVGAVAGSWEELSSGGAASSVEMSVDLPALSRPSTGMYAACAVMGFCVSHATGWPPSRASARSSAHRQPRILRLPSGPLRCCVGWPSHAV
jgi:hypothetical protein